MSTTIVVGSARAIFTVSLLSAATEEVRVGWITQDGTALAGRDYEANSGTVTFAAGETSKQIEIFVNGRTIDTEDRMFYVSLTPPVNAVLADDVGACIIHVDTTGSEPVLTVIIPKGEKGVQGDSAYQIALNNGFVGTQTEWLASLRPSPADIAPLVAPLISAGAMSVVASGTEGLTPRDMDTVAGFAGRIAYMSKTKKAIAAVLAAGVNVIPLASFAGDAVDPLDATGFNVVAFRAGKIESLAWEYLPGSAEIRIVNGQAGDVPIAVQQDIGVGDLSKTAVTVDGATRQLTNWLKEFAVIRAEVSAADALISADVAKLRKGATACSPDQFGAVGDGVADDTQAVKDALATGLMVFGLPGKKYGVTGMITLPPVARLSGIELVPLVPNAENYRVIYQTGGIVCELSRVKIDRNGSGAGGQMGNSAAIYIASCAGIVRIDRCEVTGKNFGDGIIVTDSKVSLSHNHVHDMTWGTATGPAKGDDVMQGFFLARCSGELVGNRAERLKGIWTGQAVALHRWTRGFAFSGCYDLSLLGNSTDTVDQGFDYSGGENNRRISATSNHTVNSYTWGHKCANTVTDCTFTACTAYRSGLAGFVASSPSSSLGSIDSSTLTQNITYVGCHSTFNGWGGYFPNDGQRGGFLAINSTAYPEFPRGIKWIGCKSYGAAASQVGFRNDVAVPDNSTFWNEAVDCESRDSVADFAGLNQGLVMRRGASGQSIPNGAATVVDTGTLIVDKMAFGGGVIRRSGLYTISGNVRFTGAQQGVRTLRIMRNGVLIPDAEFTTSPNPSSTTVAGSSTLILRAGETIRLEVLQDSGTALTLVSASLTVAEVGKGQC